MRILCWAALAVLLFFAMPAPQARGGESALAQNRRQTFVVEVCASESHASAIGSAVVVGRDGDVLTLATAAHVVSQKGTLRILDASRHAYYAVVHVHLLSDYDLALIRVRAQNSFPAAPASFAQPVAGEAVWIWGHTGSGFWELARGHVRETDAKIPGVFGSPRITIDCAACSYGDSGSGVFDAQGNLLGILTRAWSKANGGPVLFIEVEPAALISQEILAER